MDDFETLKAQKDAIEERDRERVRGEVRAELTAAPGAPERRCGVYGGMVGKWRCTLPAGHEGVHSWLIDGPEPAREVSASATEKVAPEDGGGTRLVEPSFYAGSDAKRPVTGESRERQVTTAPAREVSPSATEKVAPPVCDICGEPVSAHGYRHRYTAGKDPKREVCPPGAIERAARGGDPTLQCESFSPLPYFYKGSISYPNCIFRKGHIGQHRTSVAYGEYDFSSEVALSFPPARALPRFDVKEYADPLIALNPRHYHYAEGRVTAEPLTEFDSPCFCSAGIDAEKAPIDPHGECLKREGELLRENERLRSDLVRLQVPERSVEAIHRLAMLLDNPALTVTGDDTYELALVREVEKRIKR
jgi:hypothetical protein